MPAGAAQYDYVVWSGPVIGELISPSALPRDPIMTRANTARDAEKKADKIRPRWSHRAQRILTIGQDAKGLKVVKNEKNIRPRAIDDMSRPWLGGRWLASSFSPGDKVTVDWDSGDGQVGHGGWLVSRLRDRIEQSLSGGLNEMWYSERAVTTPVHPRANRAGAPRYTIAERSALGAYQIAVYRDLVRNGVPEAEASEMMGAFPEVHALEAYRAGVEPAALADRIGTAAAYKAMTGRSGWPKSHGNRR